ncbi:MAG: PfkB family carbohydrate kinase [Candidatus Helarchaeota archaeon]
MTFGEVMLRLSPPSHERIETTNYLNLKVGGSEANVAVNLSRLGVNTGFITKLTDNPLGRKIENELRRWNVDVSNVIWTDNFRVGTYYVEFGADPRPSNIIYDRTYSAISEIEIDELNLNCLKECKLFHTSGITVALSQKCELAVKKYLEFAKEIKKITSFDLNYRSKLWRPQEASKKLQEILPDIDILFSSEGDLDVLFPNKKNLKEKCLELIENFSLEIIVITRRAEPPYILDRKENELYGTGYRPVMIDRIGAGDAFDAGFIHGYLEGDIEKGLKYAEAMSALKFSIPGDFSIIYKEEIEDFIKKENKFIKR